MKRIAPTTLQRLAAGTAVVLSVALAIAGVFFFRTRAPDQDESFWRLLLSDRLTLGFVRLATVALALYAISSVAALVVGGRWLKTFSTHGFEADDLRVHDETVATLEAAWRGNERDLDKVILLFERGPDG